MQDLGRILIIVGIMAIVIGTIFCASSKIPFLGRLPGDILIKKENFTFYFPLATSIVVSIVLTLIISFFHRS